MSAVDAADEIKPRLDGEVRTGVLEDLEAEAIAGSGGTVVYDGEESLEPRHGNLGVWWAADSG